jgi:hypothetical protein
VVLLLVLGLSGSLHAGRIFQTISHDGSSNMIVEVKVEDYFDVNNVHTGVKISATIIPGADGWIGDITDLFFDYSGAIPATVNVSGVSSNDSDADAGDVKYIVGHSLTPNNIFGVYSFGFETGQPGVGGGGPNGPKLDIQWIMFNVGSTPVLSANNFTRAAVRLQTVGLPGGNRNASLKMYDPDGPDPTPDTDTAIPEPSTWLMMGAGLGLVALAKMRRARRS